MLDQPTQREPIEVLCSHLEGLRRIMEAVDTLAAAIRVSGSDLPALPTDIARGNVAKAVRALHDVLPLGNISRGPGGARSTSAISSDCPNSLQIAARVVCPLKCAAPVPLFDRFAGDWTALIETTRRGSPGRASLFPTPRT